MSSQAVIKFLNNPLVTPPPHLQTDILVQLDHPVGVVMHVQFSCAMTGYYIPVFWMGSLFFNLQIKWLRSSDSITACQIVRPHALNVPTSQ